MLIFYRYRSIYFLIHITQLQILKVFIETNGSKKYFLLYFHKLFYRYILNVFTIITSISGRIGVWREIVARYNRNNVIPVNRSGRITKSYWSWISGDDPGALVPIERRMNAEIYVQLLNDHLWPGINARYPGNETIFVIEDNSPVHRAHIVTQWYEDHPRIQRLNHPPRSPDINYIENMWAEMVKEWRPVVARNQNQLIAAIDQSWEELQNDLQYFVSLTDSMPRRLRKVIAVRGAYTKY